MVRSDPKIQWVQPVLRLLSDLLPPKAPTDHSARSDPQLLEVRMVRSDRRLQWVQPVLRLLSDPVPPKALKDPVVR